MNPGTGDIKRFENEAKASRMGYTVLLTENDALKLQGMSRSERRAWLKRQGKKKNS